MGARAFVDGFRFHLLNKLCIQHKEIALLFKNQNQKKYMHLVCEIFVCKLSNLHYIKAKIYTKIISSALCTCIVKMSRYTQQTKCIVASL